MVDRLIYQSRAVGMPQRTLDAIYLVSVPNNRRAAITGALGFSQGCYLQLLEGPVSAIDDLIRTLEADPRHTDLRVLLRASSQTRLLPGWSMARVDLSNLAPEVEALLRQDDGLGLMALLASLAHEGLTA